MSVIQAWVDVPNNRCIIITKTLAGQVTRSLGVSQPEGQLYVFVFRTQRLTHTKTACDCAN